MLIMENILDTSYLEYLQYIVQRDVQWHCLEDGTLGDRSIRPEDNESFSFAHILFASKINLKSEFWPVFLPAIIMIQNKFNLKDYIVTRARLGLITKNGEHVAVHQPHVDYDTPHKVILFYINSTNGPTTIYKEKNQRNNITPKTFNVMKQVESVANRAFMFDGDNYHSSSKPTNSNFRFVLNINLELQ